jgi:hypothetical protein
MRPLNGKFNRPVSRGGASDHHETHASKTGNPFARGLVSCHLAGMHQTHAIVVHGAMDGVVSGKVSRLADPGLTFHDG